jgi:Arc/MetJ-type ribon-helix-helix transcriptional regulator
MRSTGESRTEVIRAALKHLLEDAKNELARLDAAEAELQQQMQELQSRKAKMRSK